MIDVVIPTYNRSEEVISRAIFSILDDDKANNLAHIIVIDQNEKELKLKDFDVQYLSYREDLQFKFEKKIICINKLSPSLPFARNIGGRVSSAKYLVFFDDDVVLNPGTIDTYAKLFHLNEYSFVGGQEILTENEVRNKDRSLIEKIKNKLRNFVLKDEVAIISKYGFFFCDFSKEHIEACPIDTVRGCNFGVTREAFNEVGGFDPNFRVNSLREETDFIIRIRKTGRKGVFTSQASVVHFRQFGGCQGGDPRYRDLGRCLSVG